MRFNIQAIDCQTGQIHDMTIDAATFDSAIYIVESNPNHEFEIIEIEKDS
jgi:hypothetical protein